MTYPLCPEELCVRVCAESILDMSDCIRKYIYTRHYDACSSHKLLPFLQVGIGSELEKAMTTHSGTLAWKNPMDRGAWRAAVHGVAMSRTRLSDFTFTFHFLALEKEMATHSSVLAWRTPGTGEPGGLPSVGSHRVRHD